MFFGLDYMSYPVRCPICITTIHCTLLVNTLVSFPFFDASLMLDPGLCALPEQFSNGITIISLYLNPLPGSAAPPIEHSIFQVKKEASLLFCLPDNPFFLANFGSSTGHAVQEATYACAALCLSCNSFFSNCVSIRKTAAGYSRSTFATAWGRRTSSSVTCWTRRTQLTLKC
jgi:hypothetical protein